MRDGAIDFVGAEIGGAAGEIVVDCGEEDARIDGGGAGLEAEIEIFGIVETCGSDLSGIRDLDEDVVIDENAVLVLPRRFAVLLRAI